MEVTREGGSVKLLFNYSLFEFYTLNLDLRFSALHTWIFFGQKLSDTVTCWQVFESRLKTVHACLSLWALTSEIRLEGKQRPFPQESVGA